MVCALLGSLIAAGCGASPPSTFETTGPSAAPTGAGAAPTGAGPTPLVSPTTQPSPAVTLPPTSAVLAEVDAPAGFISKISCSGQIGASDPVAIVAAEVGSRVEYIMRDYAEVTNPRTVCTFPDPRVHLLYARHVMLEPCAATEETCAWAIVDLPEVRYHWYDLPAAEDNFHRFLAVAPDLAAIAWTERERHEDYADRSLHLRDATGEHLVSGLEPLQYGDCGPDLVTVAAFSRVGRYLYVIDQYVSSRLYIVDGHDLEQSLDSAYSAVWSPTSNTLYFRNGQHVYRWSPDLEPVLLRRDLEWTNPTISPDGSSLAYAIPNDTGGHDIYLADPAHLDQARRIAENASLPVFLNNERLWYKTEGTGGCGGENVPPRATVYNLTTSTTASTVFTEVLSVWPASR